MKTKIVLFSAVVALAALATVLFAGGFSKGADGVPALAGKCHTCAGCGADKAHASAGDAAHATADYPIDVCVVSDEKLGSMGEPYTFVHEGAEVKLCCKSCLREFHRNPAGHLEKLRAGS